MSESDTTPAAPPRRHVRVRWLRLLAILLPLAALAAISTAFGMMMAVVRDLPSLEQLPQIAKRKNSIVYDVKRRPLTELTANDGRIIVSSKQISTNVKNAVIAIEDERFYSNVGVDLRGIARAAWQDATSGGAVQGGSTITQQFIKNALDAQDKRTILQKAREAALAFHLTRKWSKERILTEYLNSIYFGNGAYGIEAAAKTYFGSMPANKGCGTGKRPRCAEVLTAAEGAMLAAIIASPSAFDPTAHPVAAKRRRGLVLRKMLDFGMITAAEYRAGMEEPIPTASQLTLPKLETPYSSEYFVSWVRQSLVDHVGAQRAFEGNLRIRTTLDLDMQLAAENAIKANLGWPGAPASALVAIDNTTGEVRAMVGGKSYNERPFNLATQGRRQPGSAMKPFILARALMDGIGPNTVLPSRKREFKVPGGNEIFQVKNFGNSYLGSASLATALTYSDNAVFSALGIQIGTKRIARLARRAGIRTPISSNYAMTLGGLKQGVTPLDMAHAYQTFAANGRRISGTLGTSHDGPVGISSISRVRADGKLVDVARNHVRATRVIPADVDATLVQLLRGPVERGSARRAKYGSFAAGKTGTTENSGDAWFVGFTRRWTVAVWVGYPDGLRPMETEFGGEPVTGGTFPALIWKEYVRRADAIVARRSGKDRSLKEVKAPNGDAQPNAVTAGTETQPQPPTGSPAASNVPTPTTGGGAPNSAVEVKPPTTPPSPSPPPTQPQQPTTKPKPAVPAPSPPAGSETGGISAPGG